MALPNTEKLTSQLAMMSPDQLKQMAMMYKQDPYIFPLIISEDGRRKQVRMASANAQAQPQPKVVDQAMASIGPLPEDQGIGQLPAPNIARMADGGIAGYDDSVDMAGGGMVAFEEGGSVPRFNGRYGSVPSLTAEQIQKLYELDPKLARQAAIRASMPSILGPVVVPGAVALGGEFATLKAAEDMASMTPEQRKGFYSNPMMGAMSPDSALSAAIMNAGVGPDQTGEGSTYGQQMTNVGKALLQYPGTVDYGKLFSSASTPTKETKPKTAVESAVQAAVDAASKAEPTGETGLRPGGGGNQGLRPGGVDITGLTQSATGTAQELINMQNMFPDALSFSEQEAINKYALAKRQSKEKGLEALEADINKQGPGMEEAYARAQAREKRLGEREKEAGPMALIQAGLAIMGGRSPHALTNIGEGGAQGLKTYADNLDRLELARDKLDETFSRIESFQENRKDMNAREVRAAKAEIRDTYTEAQKLGLDALMKNKELNRADARTAFDVMSRNRLGILSLESQERIAASRNAMYENIYGQQNKAVQEYGRLQIAVQRSLEKNPDYQLADAKTKEQMETAALQAAIRRNPFLATYGTNVGFTSAPTGGRVLKLPNPADE